MTANPFAILDDGRVADMLRHLHAKADRQMPGLLLHYLAKQPRVLLGGSVHFDESQIRGFYSDKYIALEREQAAFCHLTALSIRARTIVEFGSSFGVSTLWLAAAARATGGRVIGTELIEEKAERARANVEAAGLRDFVEIRTGDAMETLREEPNEIDLLLNDGFPMLALDIVRMLRPRMRPGAVVLTDNVGTFKANYRDYLAFVRDPRNGYRSVTLPFKSGTEYSVRLD